MTIEKSQLRQHHLGLRAALSDEERQQQGAAAVMRLASWLSEQNFPVKTAALYSALRYEAPTSALEASLVLAGWQVAYPRVVGKEQPLEFRWGRQNSFRRGVMDILEPGQNHTQAPLESLALIVVPGLAFDRRGYRLGYGAGYYDRTLAQSRAITCGLAFDCQIVDMLPNQPHDVPLSMIVTPSQLYPISPISPVSKARE